MTITFIREVSIRYRGPRRKASIDPIKSADGAAAFVRRVLPDNVREHFITLHLDGAHSVCGFYIAATGTAVSCPVAMREIFQPAVMAGAVAIICAHNHPGNSVTPSAEDRTVTAQLVNAGHLLGIPLLDHIIVTEERHYSFCEENALPHAQRT